MHEPAASLLLLQSHTCSAWIARVLQLYQLPARLTEIPCMTGRVVKWTADVAVPLVGCWRCSEQRQAAAPQLAGVLMRSRAQQSDAADLLPAWAVLGPLDL